MNREKQIEEMAKDLCALNMPCEECHLYKNGCHAKKYATRAYNAGYRKASDVARETVEAIKNEASKKEQYVSDLYGYGGYVIATTDLEDIIRRYMFDTYEEAELKKKYTEGGE